jgi:Delta7-sterol 5-desaturase
VDHSGVKLPALWPWQGHSQWHDDHHRFFHCNFGQNLYLWDWFHGTLARQHVEYGEHIFMDGGSPEDTILGGDAPFIPYWDMGKKGKVVAPYVIKQGQKVW